MPAILSGPCGTAVACEAELCNGQTLLRGSETVSASVVWSRIHCNLDRFSVVDQFKGRMASSGATKDTLERLMIGMGISSALLLTRTQ